MKLYDILKEKELIAQSTNEEKVSYLLNNKEVVFYMGFDPTANSLHVGHLVQMMIIALMQKSGHKPIVLFGGGTALIGDPSGKTDMRKMLSKEVIEKNVAAFKKQMSRLIDFSEGKKNTAIMVNNSDWLLNLNYIDFLREIGVHFSVNRMLSFECYKQRLEKGLSFFELNYMLMQSYDFLYLNEKYDCVLELGGDDQWSNIIGGVELVRKKKAKEIFGLTFSLLTTSSGKKMGKTESGAIWLDPLKTSPYEFYQYFRNVEDASVIKCLKMLTFLPIDEVKKLSTLSGRDLNKAKEILAFEVTSIVHGQDEAIKAQEASRDIFENKTQNSDMPTIILKSDVFFNDRINIIDLLIHSNIASSKSEGRRLIDQGGISILRDNKSEKISSSDLNLSKGEFSKNNIVIKKGKKTFKKIVLE